MDNLETYNRVPTLESQFIKRLLILCYIVIVGGVIIGLTSYFLLAKPWPYTLATCAAALIICVLANNYDNHRQKRCRFCGSTLTYVLRPLLLTQKFLSMEGRKIGNFFYTQRKLGGVLRGKGWVKLSNQSLACHHCRLTEETYREIQESLSPEELQQVEGTNA